MPWCDECSRYLTPNSVRADGACPVCESTVATATRTGPDGAVGVPTAPWHFKLLVVAATAYLGWRLVEFLVWLVT